MLKTETTLDTQVAVGHRVIAWRSDFDDLVVLYVQRERAANTAVWADRVGLRLLLFLPCAGLAHVVLTRKHECSGGADLNAVAAIDARRVSEINIKFGRDANIEATACNTDSKSVLPLLATRIDTLVAHDAFGIVAHIQLVVDLDWLQHI